MVLRFLIRYFMNERVVNKLADSYPIRRAAKWVVFLFHKGKIIKESNPRVVDQSLNSPKLNIVANIVARIATLLRREPTFKPLKEEKTYSQEVPTQKPRDKESFKFRNMSNIWKKNNNSNVEIEDKLKKYVEDLKRRTKE